LDFLGINGGHGHEGGDLAVTHLHHRIKVGRIHEDGGSVNLGSSLGGNGLSSNGGVGILLAESLEEASLLASLALLLLLSATSLASSSAAEASAAAAKDGKDAGNSDEDGSASLSFGRLAIFGNGAKSSGREEDCSFAPFDFSAIKRNGFGIKRVFAAQLELGDIVEGGIALVTSVRHQELVVAHSSSKGGTLTSGIRIFSRRFLDANGSSHIGTNRLGGDSTAEIEKNGVCVGLVNFDVGHVDILEGREVIIVSVLFDGAARVGQSGGNQAHDKE